MSQASSILGALALLGGVAAGCGSSAGTAGTGGVGVTSGTRGSGAGGSAPTCDPFTGAPCKLAMGESCDIDLDGSPHCFPPPSGEGSARPCWPIC